MTHFKSFLIPASYIGVIFLGESNQCCYLAIVILFIFNLHVFSLSYLSDLSRSSLKADGP